MNVITNNEKQMKALIAKLYSMGVARVAKRPDERFYINDLVLGVFYEPEVGKMKMRLGGAGGDTGYYSWYDLDSHNTTITLKPDDTKFLKVVRKIKSWNMLGDSFAKEFDYMGFKHVLRHYDGPQPRNGNHIICCESHGESKVINLNYYGGYRNYVLRDTFCSKCNAERRRIETEKWCGLNLWRAVYDKHEILDVDRKVHENGSVEISVLLNMKLYNGRRRKHRLDVLLHPTKPDDRTRIHDIEFRVDGVAKEHYDDDFYSFFHILKDAVIAEMTTMCANKVFHFEDLLYCVRLFNHPRKMEIGQEGELRCDVFTQVIRNWVRDNCNIEENLPSLVSEIRTTIRNDHGLLRDSRQAIDHALEKNGIECSKAYDLSERIMTMARPILFDMA